MNNYVLRIQKVIFYCKIRIFASCTFFNNHPKSLFSIAYVAAVYIITLFSDVSPCFHRLFLFSSCELMLLWGPCVVADILVLQYHEIFNDSNYAQFLQFPVKKVLVKKYWKCVLAVNKQKNIYWKFLKHVTREISEV